MLRHAEVLKLGEAFQLLGHLVPANAGHDVEQSQPGTGMLGEVTRRRDGAARMFGSVDCNEKVSEHRRRLLIA
jgi:hypothetical protein